jgi:hypothetical protein
MLLSVYGVSPAAILAVARTAVALAGTGNSAIVVAGTCGFATFSMYGDSLAITFMGE